MRTVDLFCGCGGLSLGFQNSGYEIVGAFDSWQEAVNCYNANFDHEAHILDLSHKNIALREIRPLNPEIIIGGPPCQGYSNKGIDSENESKIRSPTHPPGPSLPVDSFSARLFQ